MQLTGVAGWPVAHSRSPQLHRAAFADLGLTNWESQLLPIPPEVFEETVRSLSGNGFAGINVTIPHKEAALRLADSATDAAKAIGAANTLTFSEDGSIAAANTDSPAIESVVRQTGLGNLETRNAVVLGAGGSARAAVHALQAAGLAEVAVWGRNTTRASGLASDFEGVTSVDSPAGFSIVVNATPVGLTPGSSPSDLGFESGLPHDCELLVDLVYAEATTKLGELANEAGIEFVDGLEILVRQGALSLEIWTGQLPALAVLRAAVASS